MAVNTELDNATEAVEDSTSTGEATATGQQEQSRQPTGKVDLSSLPEFREWQAAADRRAQAAEYMANQAAQRAANLEQQFHQQRMAGMEGEERLAYQNQLLQQQLQAVQQQRELDAYAIQRQRDLEEIARETGVPMADIANVPNVHEGWLIGNKYAKAQLGKAAPPTRQEEIERTADDRVDLGGGKPQGRVATLQAEYDAAAKAYDMGKMLDVMAKADRQGVTIKEW